MDDFEILLAMAAGDDCGTGGGDSQSQAAAAAGVDCGDATGVRGGAQPSAALHAAGVSSVLDSGGDGDSAFFLRPLDLAGAESPGPGFVRVGGSGGDPAAARGTRSGDPADCDGGCVSTP